MWWKSLLGVWYQRYQTCFTVHTFFYQTDATWTNNWNKLTNQFPSHNMIQDLPSFDKRYSDTQFVSLTVNDWNHSNTPKIIPFRALVRILELRVLLLKVRQSWKQNHFQYIKLSQRSSFGRIENTINCFRDLLTFRYIVEFTQRYTRHNT